MPSNHFLDYLCSIGYADKRDIWIETPQPSYPHRAFQCRGSHFHSTITQYTVGIGIAKCDNTRVVIPMYRRASSQTEQVSSISILEKILAFMENLGKQRGGIPFTTKYKGRPGPGIHAQYPEDPVNTDVLFLAASLFGPPPGTSLDLAWALEYFRSLMVEIKQNEAEYKAKEKEILVSSSKIGEYFPNKGEYEAKKKEIFEKYREGIENKRSSDNTKNESKEEKHDAKPTFPNFNTAINKDTTVFRLNIAMSDYDVRSQSGEIILSYKRGDTISYQKEIYYKSGSVMYCNPEFYVKNSGEFK